MPLKKIKTGTWNVNSIKVRLPRLLDFLRKESPDVLCLQEIKCEEQNFPFLEIKQAGYEALVSGQKTYNGVALLHKNPLALVVKGFDDGDEDTAARFIGGKSEEGVFFYSVYVPNGQEVGSDKYAYKLKWLQRMRAYFKTHHKPTDKITVCGDFNIAPEDRDVYDPIEWRGKILCSDRERKSLREFTEMGFVDTFRLFEPGAGHYTWWDYRQLAFQKNLGLRIDFILASEGLTPACKEVLAHKEERKGEKPSDHIPITALFSI